MHWSTYKCIGQLTENSGFRRGRLPSCTGTWGRCWGRCKRRWRTTWRRWWLRSWRARWWRRGRSRDRTHPLQIGIALMYSFLFSSFDWLLWTEADKMNRESEKEKFRDWDESKSDIHWWIIFTLTCVFSLLLLHLHSTATLLRRQSVTFSFHFPKLTYFWRGKGGKIYYVFWWKRCFWRKTLISVC